MSARHIALVLSLGLLTACPGEGPTRPDVSRVSLDPAAAFSIVLGLTRVVNATPLSVQGVSLTDQSVSWTTSSPGVIAIQPLGLGQQATLVAVALGTSQISAISGGKSATVEVTVTAPPAPNTPSGLTATVSGGTQVDLSWSRNSTDETQFRIERRSGGGAFVQIATVGAGVTTFSNTGLTPATTYEYQVRACNAGGCSGYSNLAQATTLSPPGVPAGLTATAVSATQIDLAWTRTSTNETEFRIERRTVGGAFAQIGTTGPGVTTLSNTGLTAATTYEYQVRACNAVGCSVYSAIASAISQPVTPTTPTGLTATAISATQINLAWTRTSTNETEFRIERRLVGGVFAQIATTGPGITTFSSTGLTAATTYEYQVRACNTVGCSGFTTVASATTLAIAPTIPTGLTATAVSSTQINLAWTRTSTNETEFRIERRLVGGVFAQITTTGPGITSFSNIGLTAATTYEYQVRACNAVGCSGFSAVASATTQALVPSAPTGLAATPVSGTQINLAWTRIGTNETEFRIERRITAGGVFAQIATTGAGVLVYQDFGVSASTAYEYRVRACNANGCSAFSNTASATTLPSFTVIGQPASYTGTTTKVEITGLVDGMLYTSVGGGAQVLTFRDLNLTPITAQRSQVPTTWATWSSPPNSESATPPIMFLGQSDMLITLSAASTTFGFELEPNAGSHPVSVDFFAGSTLVGSIAMTVDGVAGARLFAARSSVGFTHVRIVIPVAASGFGLAQFRYSTTSAAQQGGGSRIPR